MGLCPCLRQRGESGCSASTGYSSSTQPIPSPQTTQGGLDGGLHAPAAGACRRRATHHRLHREKVVRPRCAVRLAGSTHQAGPPGQWHVAALARRQCPTLRPQPWNCPPGLRLPKLPPGPKRDLVQTRNRLADCRLHFSGIDPAHSATHLLEESIGAKRSRKP